MENLRRTVQPNKVIETTEVRLLGQQGDMIGF